jgi:hypothetical protein
MNNFIRRSTKLKKLECFVNNLVQSWSVRFNWFNFAWYNSHLRATQNEQLIAINCLSLKSSKCRSLVKNKTENVIHKQIFPCPNRTNQLKILFFRMKCRDCTKSGHAKEIKLDPGWVVAWVAWQNIFVFWVSSLWHEEKLGWHIFFILLNSKLQCILKSETTALQCINYS